MKVTQCQARVDNNARNLQRQIYRELRACFDDVLGLLGDKI